jgi:hypothetical protein
MWWRTSDAFPLRHKRGAPFPAKDYQLCPLSLVPLRFEFTFRLLRRKLRRDCLLAVAIGFAVAFLPAAPYRTNPAAQITKKRFVGAYWQRMTPQSVSAGFFFENQFER